MPPIGRFAAKLHAECGIKKTFKICNLQPSSRNRHGFTLIEVLLAISILVFVVSIVYASFSTTSNNVKQAEVIRDNTDLARTLLIKISDDIENAYVSSASANFVPTIFYGKKEEVRNGGDIVRRDSLYLTTLTNWRRLNSQEMDLWEVAYYFKENADRTGYVLMRRDKRVLSKDVPVMEGGIEYEVTDKVVGLQIRYSSDGTSWKDEWGSSSGRGTPPPMLVDLGLTLESGQTYSLRVAYDKAIR